VFNNLVNVHDASLLVEKIRQGRLRQIVSRFLIGKEKRLERSWNHVQYPLRHWWDIPEVMERWNVLISGDKNVDYVSYFLHKYFSGRDSLTALSLGCGTGHREVKLARLGMFERIDAVDISKARIEHAREKSEDQGYDNVISYVVGDVYTVPLPSSSYDLVIVEQSLHHFSPLDRILNRIHACLSSSGCFIFNEYVGPARFQWTDKQLEVINDLLSRFPERYRRRWKSGTVKRKVHRRGRLSMTLWDPSEAIESHRILPFIREIFDVVEIKGYGGTVLHPLFSDIAQNFLLKDGETQHLLRMCFRVEDRLLSSGELPSDFVVGICRRREGGDARAAAM